MSKSNLLVLWLARDRAGQKAKTWTNEIMLGCAVKCLPGPADPSNKTS
jgi:hypothetical protein